jgi:integrase
LRSGGNASVYTRAVLLPFYITTSRSFAPLLPKIIRKRKSGRSDTVRSMGFGKSSSEGLVASYGVRRRALSKALKQAMMDGLIPRNADTPVKPPRPRREEMRPLNRDQVHALFDAARGDRLEALYVVAVTAGLRRGELHGLKWKDVDLEAGTLQVRRTLSEPKGGYIFEAPKNGKARSIRCSQRALEALRSYRARQNEERGLG